MDGMFFKKEDWQQLAEDFRTLAESVYEPFFQ